MTVESLNEAVTLKKGIEVSLRRSIRYFGWTYRTLVVIVLPFAGLGVLYVVAGDDFAIDETYAFLATVAGPAVGWTLLVLGYHSITTPGWLRAQRALGEFNRITSSVNDEDIRSGLRLALTDTQFPLVAAGIFGSVAQGHGTRDVDLMVALEGESPQRVRRAVNRMRILAREFKRSSGHELHIQYFLEDERNAITKFIHKAGVVEPLVVDLLGSDA